MTISVGTVKMYDEDKGVGFIEHGNGAGVTVYANAVARSGLLTLRKGQRVGFLVIDNENLLQAENIVILDNA